MKISLMVLSAGSAAGKALPVNVAQFVIGRDPQCNLRPASAMISKRHCAIISKDNKILLRDFDSTNGTFINETQIKGEVALRDGDVLKVGPLSFKVVIEGQPAPSKPTPPPKPKSVESSDEDAAAAMLAIDDDNGQISVSSSETAEDQVPGGTTMMDMPAFVPAPAGAKENAVAPDVDTVKTEAKAPDNKPDAKPKPPTGAASKAAQALFEKLRAGKRK